MWNLHWHVLTPAAAVVVCCWLGPLSTEQNLALLFQSLSLAVKQISAKVARAGLEGLYGVAEQQGGGSGDTQKKLDVVAVSTVHVAAMGDDIKCCCSRKAFRQDAGCS
jgi:fructose-1,6-bisphosphatase